MTTRFLLLLALTCVTPLALAQDGPSRVQREANNPLRMIIEASKIKPKARPADSARPAEKPAAASQPVATVSAPELPRVPAVAMPVESAVVTVDVPEAARPVPEPAPPEAEPTAPAPAVPLQLASMVEPVMPRSLVGKLRGEVQVHVAFTVNPDGSVADAAVRSSTHPQMDAAVLEAVRQWRYQPIAAPRGHEVQLVLRQDS